MRFCSHLADRLHHSSVKVYLSGICSLHLDMGFSDPLSNCLQLQRVLSSINSHQDSTKAHASQSQGSLKKFSPLSYPKTTHTPCFGLPAALVFFGFLRGSEFIGTSIHPSFQDLYLQLDSTSNPTYLHAHIKTDPFVQGCFIYFSRRHSYI